MKNDKIYNFLLKQRLEGDENYFTASEIAKELNITNNGGLFRRMNQLAVIYEVLEVKLTTEGNIKRLYRIKKTELKNGKF